MTAIDNKRSSYPPPRRPRPGPGGDADEAVYLRTSERARAAIEALPALARASRACLNQEPSTGTMHRLVDEVATTFDRL